MDVERRERISAIFFLPFIRTAECEVMHLKLCQGYRIIYSGNNRDMEQYALHARRLFTKTNKKIYLSAHNIKPPKI